MAYVLLNIAQEGASCDGGIKCLGYNIHYNDVTMDAIASQITSLTIVYSTVYSDTDQRKHQSSASLAFVRGIHKWPVTRKMFPFDDVIIIDSYCSQQVIFQITNPLHNSCVRSEAHFHPDIRLTGIRQGGPLLYMTTHCVRCPVPVAPRCRIWNSFFSRKGLYLQYRMPILVLLNHKYRFK